MNVKEFVQRMNAIIVQVSESDRAELSSDFLKSLLNSYKIYPKAVIKPVSNPIFDLIHNYNCSNVHIGDITFNDVIEEDDKYFYFGSYHGDELTINRRTGEVELRQYGVNHTLCFCGKDQISFLEALLIAAEYISQITVDLTEDQYSACLAAGNCSKAAGGRQFLSFYKTLTGCEN